MRLRRSYAKSIPGYPQKYQVREVIAAWSPSGKAYKEPPESFYAGARTAIVSKKPALVRRTLKPAWFSARKPTPAIREADKIVDRILHIAVDPDLRDEDESAPPLKVVQEAVELVRGAEKLLDAMPYGQVSSFYGEINITWRVGDRIVRLACFPDRSSVVQTGSLSLPLGSHRSEQNPTAEMLADKIGSLDS